MLFKSLIGEEIAKEPISMLSVSYSICPNDFLGAIRDRAAINNVAMQMTALHPDLVDIRCFTQTIDHDGCNFKMPILSNFTSLWLSLFSHSPKIRLLWRN